MCDVASSWQDWIGTQIPARFALWKYGGQPQFYRGYASRLRVVTTLNGHYPPKTLR